MGTSTTVGGAVDTTSGCGCDATAKLTPKNERKALTGVFSPHSTRCDITSVFSSAI
ncbi:MAG: hypothetical protein QW270_08680 [Candidatus Bathyarchaeia archaeon]